MAAIRDRLGVRLYEDWKRLPRERRRDVEEAVAKGRAVTDPRDAELAARLARSLNGELAQADAPPSRFDRGVLVFYVLSTAIALLAAAFAIAQGANELWVLVGGLGVLEVVLHRLDRGRREALRRSAAAAEAANEPLIPEDSFKGA